VKLNIFIKSFLTQDKQLSSIISVYGYSIYFLTLGKKFFNTSQNNYWQQQNTNDTFSIYLLTHQRTKK